MTWFGSRHFWFAIGVLLGVFIADLCWPAGLFNQ